MKYLPIFVLFLVACSDVTLNKCLPAEVTISDANPIQFWPVDCDTYNEKEVCGVHSKCWCQPLECDDDVPIQFTDQDPDGHFQLNIYSEDNALLETLDFSSEQVFTNDFDFSFEETFNASIGIFQQAGNIGTQAQWNWSGGSITADGSTGPRSDSFELYTQRTAGIGGYIGWPPGQYRFRFIVSNLSSGGSAPLQETLSILAKNSLVGSAVEGTGVTVPRGTTDQEYVIDLTLSFEYDYLTFQVTKAGPSTGSQILASISSIELLSYPADFSYSVHSVSFIPSELNICDSRIKLIISDVSTGSEGNVLKSDCLDVKTSHSCTKSIEYSNNRNFAGLVYENVTPEITFKLRVPVIFFHERFPEEDEVIRLNGSVEKLRGTLESQRLFETDYLPYYMHKKIQLALKHQTVLIENQYWTKAEAYEIQDGERRWPVKKAKCFLTERDYLQRAIL